VYRDITAAMVDKATLDAAGIKCFLYDDNLVRLDWFISNAVDGVRLVVAEDNAPEAAHILASAVPIADDEPAGPGFPERTSTMRPNRTGSANCALASSRLAKARIQPSRASLPSCSSTRAYRRSSDMRLQLQ